MNRRTRSSRIATLSFLFLLASSLEACTSSTAVTETTPSPLPASTIPVAQPGEGMETGTESPAELDEWLDGLSKKERALVDVTAELADPTGDAQTAGAVVDFADILKAAVHGNGKFLDLILTMSGPVPEVMPNDTTYMIVAWNLAGNKKIPTAGFSAQAGSNGWTLSAAQNSDTTDFPGGFDISGNEIVMRIPWRYIKTPHEFEWSAAVTWATTSTDQSSQGSSADNVTGGKFKSPDR